MIGSRSELKEKALEEINESIDLHRPYVDEIHIKCPKCGKTMSRVKDVIDCWFDSGAMPFAQYHYPFENVELFNSQFPADFICEGIDQTRGWFYSLLVISAFVKGCSPYKNVLVNELLLDKNGQKMHKSKGNAIEPFTIMKKYGADTVRWYLPYVSPVWTPLKFDEEGLKEVYSKFFNPLKNTYSFFALYANTDEIDINDCNIGYEDLELIDKWLLSKYNNLLKYVTESYEEYDLNKVVRSITDFVCDDLSNWYIRRNRKRFWGSTLDNSKKAVYKTTYDVLVGISKMIAPIVPFISEEIYTKLTNEYSVHTSDFPKYEIDKINIEIERKMDLVRDLISSGRYVREETKIKVRQPLSEALLDSKNESIIGNLSDLIKEELNVKEIKYVSNLNEYMNFTVKPNFKLVGRIFGKNINVFANKLNDLEVSDINKLQNNETIPMVIDDTNYEIDLSMVDIRISSKEGFNVGTINNEFIILDTTLTDELIMEGIARETISKIQQLRKTNDFNVVDRIKVYYNGDNEFTTALNKNIEFIKNETLAKEFILDENLTESFDINDHDVKLKVERI